MIPAYLDFLPQPLLDELVTAAEPCPDVPGLSIAPGQRAAFPAVETTEALEVVCEVYRTVHAQLSAVLEQRKVDRVFLDAVCAEDPHAVLGAVDSAGRVVAGPTPSPDCAPVVVPDWLQGEHVTLFGPPDTPKMAINAMNALHRRRADEPELVGSLVSASGQVPRWGADDEDSKTPIMRSFLAACENLIGCFDGTLSFDDEARGRSYRLADRDLALPIKRFPGLALPDGSHLLDGSPLPLHLVDFVLHSWHNRTRPQALVFYVPKLENEEEAAYLAALIRAAESAIHAREPSYVAGTIRVLLVFENPRAIFRIRAMAHALEPWFVGGSLGWHDFLASTARLYKNDPAYRIPVKADPDIVIRHIRESHRILVRELGSLGAITIGGMYGILFEEGDAASYRVTMVGFIRDVVTQMKRGLGGFWVAHPDFVRVGIALVEAWRRHERGDSSDLTDLVRALVPDEVEQGPLVEFVFGPDVEGLTPEDPGYARAVLAADLAISPIIRNDDPDEVRYNVFQALQYLADWLCGNGCVALPATMTDRRGDTVFVRVMDDLATTERSRWELWAEVAHGRVSTELFEQILAEEMAFIREGRATATRKTQVRWAGDAVRWYPVAEKLLRQLVCSDDPPEFVTELTLAFTFDVVRDAKDPWAAASALCPGRFGDRRSQ
ncbi:MAG: hypothetical protein GY913_32795 [Proteobacteria bacterium]|nr:hypothetical protein [Pseudomonadota bacterium]MCP4921702.1 hypothetical protein [Pseudomonadota bacterium]